jgi:hypothetical protein
MLAAAVTVIELLIGQSQSGSKKPNMSFGTVSVTVLSNDLRRADVTLQELPSPPHNIGTPCTPA